MVLHDLNTMQLFNENYPDFEKNTLGKTPFLILVHALYCGHCVNMKPDWDAAVLENSHDTPIAQVEHAVFQHLTSVHGDNTLARLMKESVKGFPFIATVSRKGPNDVIDVTEYNDGRTKEGFAKVMKKVAASQSKASPKVKAKASPSKATKAKATTPKKAAKAVKPKASPKVKASPKSKSKTKTKTQVIK